MKKRIDHIDKQIYRSIISIIQRVNKNESEKLKNILEEIEEILKDLIKKKTSLDTIKTEIEKTRIQEKKRMTANHTYNSKTQRGRLTHLSKTYISKNRSAFMNTTFMKDLKKPVKGSIFNATKEIKRNSSKLDFSDLQRINSFKTSNLSSDLKKSKNKQDLKNTKIEEDNVIVLNRNKKELNDVISNLIVYSEESEEEKSEEEKPEEKKPEDKVDKIVKIPIIKLNTNIEENEYSIKLTNVNEDNLVRRRVKTNYTKKEIDKIFEHKKNNILISKGNKMDNDNQEGDFLRVFTGQRNIKNKSHRSFNRSSTMMSDRSRSIHGQNVIEEQVDTFKFNNQLNKSRNKSKLNLKSSEINKDKNKSLGTSIDKSQMNTSIVKDQSRDSSKFHNQDLMNREKSISDTIREYKIKYKSDNVLGQMGRFDDEFNNVHQRISLEDFQIVKELGSGKFGKVIQVRRKINGDEFAVKLIPIKNTLDKNDEANLNSESEIFKTISDQYVVKAYYW